MIDSFQEIFDFFIMRISMGAPSSGAELGAERLCSELGIDNEHVWKSNIYHRDAFSNESPELIEAYREFISLSSDRVERTLKNGNLPVIFGGDHSLSLGTLAGLKKYLNSVSRDDVGIIWIDAHTDIHTPLSSTTKNLHGMPLGGAFLPNAGFLDDLRGQLSKFPTNGLCYIGARDIDPGELSVLKEYGIWSRSSEDVNSKGGAAIASEAISYLKGSGFNSAHISFDIDVMDPSFATATATPVEGGISFNDAKDILTTLINGITPVMLEIVELNPPRDTHDDSLRKMVEISKLALNCCKDKLSLLR